MSDEMQIDGKTYISSKRAAVLSGYAQDYVGQLARSGSIDARRVGGVWMVTPVSLEQYKRDSEEGKINRAEHLSLHANASHEQVQDSFVGLDGKNYISANRASVLSGYNQDYIGQMARSGIVPSRQVGNRWYVDRESLLQHKKEKDSLLAVVQTDSVGLKKATQKQETSLFQDAPLPLLNYISDEGDLLPEIKNDSLDTNLAESKNESTNSRDIVADHAVSEPDKSIYRAENILSIRKTESLGKRAANVLVLRPNQVLASPSLVQPWGKTLSLITASALTIVIVVSLGFETMKSQAQYAVSTSTPEARLTAFVGGVFDPVLDAIETLLAPEVSYRRPSR